MKTTILSAILAIAVTPAFAGGYAEPRIDVEVIAPAECRLSLLLFSVPCHEHFDYEEPEGDDRPIGIPTGKPTPEPEGPTCGTKGGDKGGKGKGNASANNGKGGNSGKGGKDRSDNGKGNGKGRR